MKTENSNEKVRIIKGVKGRLALTGRNLKGKEYKADLRWTKVIDDDEIMIDGPVEGLSVGEDIEIDVVNVMELSGKMKRRYAINARKS